MFSTTTMMALGWLAVLFVLIGAGYRWSNLMKIKKEHMLWKQRFELLDKLVEVKKSLHESRRYYINQRILAAMKLPDNKNVNRVLLKILEEIKR